MPDHGRRAAWGNIVVALLAAAAAVVAPLIVINFDLRVFSLAATVSAASLVLWLVLISTEGAVWVLVFECLRTVFLRLRQLADPSARAFLTQTLLPCLVLSIPPIISFYERSSHPAITPRFVGPYCIGNLPIIGGTGLLVGMLCVLGMYGVRIALQSQIDRGDLGARISTHIELNALLRSCLLLASITLGLGTIATAALRNAVNSAAGHTVFPAEYVVAYGLMNSIFLTVAYFPVQLLFLRTGAKLAKAYAGEPGQNTESIGLWHQRITEGTQMLGADWTDLRGITAALLALGPGVVGLLAHLLYANK